MENLLFAVEMLVLGAGVGIVSAALGIGGGILMVPAFVTFVEGMDINTAKGSSLFVIVFVAAYNSWRMNRGAMRNPWSVVVFIAAGSIVGGYLGGWVTSLMSEAAVTWLFVGLLAIAALRTFVLKERQVSEDDVRQRQLLSGAIGVVAGVVSGATGTGGGSILVPLALWAGVVSNARVVALSNTVMVATCAAAALAHARAPKVAEEMPWTIGMVNVSLVPLVFIGAIAAAPLGRRINQALTFPRRRVVMGGLIVVIAVRLVWRALSFPG